MQTKPKLKHIHPQPNGLAWRIGIAGGGTGGHLFPGISVAQEFLSRNPRNRVIFVNSGRPFEKAILTKMGFEHKSISAAGIKGRHMLKKLKAMTKIPWGALQSMLILMRFDPHLVLGVGSYSAGPVVLGARLLGIKCVLHEQNIHPGITNRMLAPLARRIYISFRSTQSSFSSRKVLFTGNPIRSEILNGPSDSAVKEIRANAHRFTVLVLGGSQGAHAINMAVAEALAHLPQPERFRFIHQTGAADVQTMQAAYQHRQIAHITQAFFDDMGLRYRQADLIVCRAGATTVAETAALGKAVVFIPYPHAADDHQVLNAASLADAGAAEIILQQDLNGRRLAERIVFFAANPKALQQMAALAKQFGQPDASRIIVDDICRLLKAA